MIGLRVFDVGPHLFQPGDYGLWNGTWYARAPGDDDRRLANLANHLVVEHDDGTITVSPSILISGGGAQWHGCLERGVWRQC